MNAAAYVRVSSRSQDAAMQRHAIERAAKARGDRIAVWFSETRSARTTARPELDRLREDARAGRLPPKLYVFRLDRLARSGIRDMFEVVEGLRAHGVRVATIGDGFDLDGAGAEIVMAVLAWAAKAERLAINERIAAARNRIEETGGRWGRPRRMDRKEIRRALELQAEGRSVRKIAQALKVPRATLARALAAAVSKSPPKKKPPAARKTAA